ncbi:hypothetical protein C923_01685, partial [Plasmodium falciparum UGT5.1]
MVSFSKNKVLSAAVFASVLLLDNNPMLTMQPMLITLTMQPMLIMQPHTMQLMLTMQPHTMQPMLTMQPHTTKPPHIAYAI